ncbi:alcohol dehydrogenase [Botrytis cinerea]
MAALPKTYKAFRRTVGTTPTTLEQTTEEIPATLSPNDVLIKIHAVSLNYRDVAMMHGNDCAAEVMKVGSNVHDFKVGDRVAPIFDNNNFDSTRDENSVLGGDIDGVLREYAVFHQDVLFHLPKHLSWEEASTITCAGVTAWNALDMPRNKGTALLQGNIQFYPGSTELIRGIKPIITSSSDKKLDIAKAVGEAGEVETINYRTYPKWEEEALKLTNGRGVDIVVDNVGPTQAAQSLTALARRGVLSLVGFLGGFKAEQIPDLFSPTLHKSLVIRGIAVGDKKDHQDLCGFLELKKISLKGIVDPGVFLFKDSQAAFDALYDGTKHQGKIVIRI